MKDINLLPEEEKTQVASAPPAPKINIKINDKALIFIIIAAVVAIGVLFIPKIIIKVQEGRYESLQNKLTSSKYAELNSVNAQYNDLSSKLSGKQEIINSIDRQSRKLTEVFTALEQAAPQGAFYTGIEYDSYRMKVSLKIDDTMQAAEYLANLKRVSFIAVAPESKTMTISNNGILTVTLNIVGKGAK